MQRSILAAIAALGLAFVLASCAAEKSSTTPAAEAEAFVNAAPAGTPMSKIKAGMTAQEVVTILGSPQAQGQYITGKAFIPFYYGDDVKRNALYYKGQGRVIITGGNVFGGGGGNVVAVEYDPTEPGIAR
jgi:outer membrane protein assembly factor BamE (lipoprotein component of BamABCDE complex)